MCAERYSACNVARHDGPRYTVPMRTVGDLVRAGGVRAFEREAAAAAVRGVQAEWLPMLEEVLEAQEPDADVTVLAYLAGEIRRLRRALGLGPSDSARAWARRLTRERVRRYRARIRARATEHSEPGP